MVLPTLSQEPRFRLQNSRKKNCWRAKAILVGKILEYTPAYAAILGIDSYRKAFAKKDARIGLQDETIGATKLWVLPNPSGLNAHFTPQKLRDVFLALKETVDNQ